MKKVDFIILPIEPKEDIPQGLLCIFDKDTEVDTNKAFADVKKGQREYVLPDDFRKIKGIYLKIQ